MQMKRFVYIFNIVFLIYFVFLGSIQKAQALIADGASAIDVIGQSTANDGVTPTYTERQANEGAGPSGFYLSNGYSVIDSVNHRLFITDSGHNRVLVYNLNSSNQLVERIPDNVLGQSDFYGSTGVSNTSTGLSDPKGLAFDSVNNRLFVSGVNRILIYDTTTITNGEAAVNVLGQADFTSSVYSTTSSTLITPDGISYDSANSRLFVADEANRRVLVYDVTIITDGEAAVNVLGQTLFTTSTNATTATGMSGPKGVSYDSVNNRLFVVDEDNSRVLVYDTTSITNGEAAVNVLGQALFTTNNGGTTSTSMYYPRAVTVDTTNNRLFVSDYNNSRVMVYDITSITDGEAAVNVLGQANFTSGTGSTSSIRLDGPYGIYYDNSNNLVFVGDYSNNRIIIYDTTSITDGEAAVDAIGQSAANDGVTPVYTEGDENDSAGPYGLNLYAQLSTSNISPAIDSIHHRLFIPDYNNNRVLIYNLNSSNQLVDKTPDNVLGQSDFYGATLANTATGMNAPVGVLYDSVDNRLFVSQNGNNRVTVYDVTSITNGEAAVNVLGQPDFTTGVSATSATGMSGPRGMAYDSTNHRLFVAQVNSNRVGVYDVTSITDGESMVNVLGEPDFNTTSYSITLTGMSNPVGVAYDSAHNRLFVVQSSRRITVYDVASITDGEAAVNVLGQADFTSSGSATTATGVNSPRGVSYDDTNQRLFVADTSNNRVLVYDVASITDGEAAVNVLGQPDFITSNLSLSATGMGTPKGTAYDSTNKRLFVADTNNNRITVYDVSVPTIPTVSNITSSTTNGSYITLDTISIQVVFSESVNVTGLPQLTLETGTTDQVLDYVSGTGSDTLTFTYTIQAGDTSADLDYVGANSLALNGGTIVATVGGLSATLTLPVPGASGSLSANKAITVNYVAPVTTVVARGSVPVWILQSISDSVTRNSLIKDNSCVPGDLYSSATGEPCVKTQSTEEIKKVCFKLPDAPSLLRIGMKHDTIKVLQAILNCKGYPVALVGAGSAEYETNIFGFLTKIAVRNFQKASGLKVDGVVGPETRLSLNK
ncbi:MAG: peptidoglycan-binding protein [Candidatus Pacebacteria bacterium]|nr:peptidoglycan-binding protein [Candidatus Paceibacterota bacterium]